MSLETFNLNLFKLINASENATDLSINVAIFIANDLLYIMLVIFLVLWFKGNFANKNKYLKLLFSPVLPLQSARLFLSFLSSAPLCNGSGKNNYLSCA